MKKSLLTAVLALTALGASAHYSNRIHYHNDDGTATYSNVFEPDIDVTYQTDQRGRTWRVETTTTCSETRVNRRNHLICLEEDVTVRRFREAATPAIRPIVERHIERFRGRLVLVTTTRTCVAAHWTPRRVPVCDRWRVDVTREILRRDGQGQFGFDLNDDGRVEQWERLLFRQFRSLLRDFDDDNGNGNDNNN